MRRRLWLLALCTLPASCTTLYQPMSGLHRPVAIDTDHANFADLSLSIHCLAGPVLEAAQAQDLCRKLAQLFENQGSTVRTRTSTRGFHDPDAEATKTGAEGSTATALNVQLSSRMIHKDETRLLFWTYVTDYTFAQDIVIRDETGFLLIKDTLTGRFVTRLGFSDDTAKDFSADYYGQLSQLALNAKLRRQVLRDSQRNATAAD